MIRIVTTAATLVCFVSATAFLSPGSVSPALYDTVNVASGLFPFKPSLRALDGAINGGELLLPLLHLLGLTAAFFVVARIAIRRFG